MKKKTLSVVAVLAAVIGGTVVALGIAVLDLGGTTKTETVVQQAPLADGAVPVSSALTPRSIYERDAPGVVYIRADIVQETNPDPLFGFGGPAQRGTATGSGFVIDQKGDILTNAHVIEGAVKITVQLGDKQAVDAKVIGKDKSSDLALLRVNPDGLNLKPLTLGSAKDVKVGDPVVAIGNPFGLDRTLTTGVVSALQRRISAPNGAGISNVIQTDAAINPGNSGGPLIDAAGRVIGINSQIETGGNGNGSLGIGFAVPIDTAKQVLGQLKSGGSLKRAFLGVTSLTIDGSLAPLNLPAKSGALVQTVQADSPAAKAGLQGGSITAQVGGNPIVLGGDIIQSVDGKPVKTSDDLASLIGGHKPGDKAKIGVLRNGKQKTLTVKLGTRSDQPQPQLQPG